MSENPKGLVVDKVAEAFNNANHARPADPAYLRESDRVASWDRKWGHNGPMEYQILASPDAHNGTPAHATVHAAARAKAAEGWLLLSTDPVVVGMPGMWLFGMPRSEYVKTAHYARTEGAGIPDGKYRSTTGGGSQIVEYGEVAELEKIIKGGV